MMDRENIAARLLGAWRLVSWRIGDESGRIDEPLGPHPTGLLVYTADGFMSASLMASARKDFAGGDPLRGTPEECAAAMRGFHSYSGRYRIEEGRVIHSVEIALCPNLVGTEQIRFFNLEGDRLVLSTPPLKRAGVIGIANLVWQRAA
jgi:hypothetical protein